MHPHYITHTRHQDIQQNDTGDTNVIRRLPRCVCAQHHKNVSMECLKCVLFQSSYFFPSFFFFLHFPSKCEDKWIFCHHRICDRCLLACHAISSTLNLPSCCVYWDTLELKKMLLPVPWSGYNVCWSIVWVQWRDDVNPQGFGLSCGGHRPGRRSLFEHDLWRLAQAVCVLGRHALVCYVVGIQTQVLQSGEVVDVDKLAETWQVEFCGGGKCRKKWNTKILQGSLRLLASILRQITSK